MKNIRPQYFFSATNLASHGIFNWGKSGQRLDIQEQRLGNQEYEKILGKFTTSRQYFLYWDRGTHWVTNTGFK